MNRYPGIQPFRADDSLLFCGRDREIKDLSQLIALNRLTVLFGKSGIGKSSLLQAGVAPMLEHWSLRPLFIRLSKRDLSPDRQVADFLHLNFRVQSADEAGIDAANWWELFQQLNGDNKHVPIVIFDQFEELFTLYTTHQRQTFIAQLADLANGRVPQYVRQKILSDLQANPNLSVDEIARREAAPSLRIVLSIRSDFLYLLDRLSNHIPAILRCRYELLPLSAVQAKDAIVLPAQHDIAKFSCPPFAYSDAALQNILQTLSGKHNANAAEQLDHAAPIQNAEIEAFQLQLLCSYIEQKVREKTAGHPPTPPYTVQPDLYGGTAGIANILSDFYQKTLANFDHPEPNSTQGGKTLRTRVQEMIEDALLNKGRRILQAQDYLCETYHLSPDILAQLTDLRLLRKENYKNAHYYEISHDTLVAPIEAFRQVRKAAEQRRRDTEEKTRLQAERDAAQRALHQERRRKAVLGILLAAALVALGIAWWSWQNAQQKEREAQANYNASQAIIYRYNTTKALQYVHTAYENKPTPLTLSAYWQSRYAYEWQWRDSTYYPPYYDEYQLSPSAAVASNETTWAISADGKTIAHLEPNGQIRIEIGNKTVWIITPSTNISTKTQQNVGIIALSPQGDKLALTRGNTAYIYDIKNKTKLSDLQHTYQPGTGGRSPQVMSLAFSPDAQYLMTDVSNNHQYLWRVDKSEKIDSFENKSMYLQGPSPMLRTQFSPDSRYLIVLPNDSTLSVYDLSTRQLRPIINSKQVRQQDKVPSREIIAINSLAFSPSGKQIAVLMSSQRQKGIIPQYAQVFVCTTNPAQNSKPLLLKIPNKSTIVAFLDEQAVVTGDDKGYVYCHNAQNGKLQCQWQAHTQAISDLDTDSQGRYVLTAAAAQPASVQDAEPQLPTQHSKDCVMPKAYPAIWEINPTRTTAIHTITLYGSDDEQVNRAYFNGYNQVVTQFNHNRARLWHLNENRPITTQNKNKTISQSIWLPDQAIIGQLRADSLVWSKPKQIKLPTWATIPNLQSVAFAASYVLTRAKVGNTMHFSYYKDSETQAIAQWTLNTNSMNKMYLSADGHYALLDNGNSDLWLYEASTGTLIAQKQWNSDATIAPVSQNGKQFGVLLPAEVTSQSSNGETRQAYSLELYECNEKQVQKTLLLPKSSLTPFVALWTNAQKGTNAKGAVAIGSDIALLDVQYRPIEPYLFGHSGSIKGLSVSPDERFLLSYADDATVRVWDIGTGVCAHVFRTAAAVEHAYITPDGRYLVADDAAGKSSVWNLLPHIEP
ncbi:MAG: hypothetical protein IT273_00920 [Chitinophagales bacterium]|nr:hypothetical protein [Chitinophagales bacterium]